MTMVGHVQIFVYYLIKGINERALIARCRLIGLYLPANGFITAQHV